MVNVRVGTKMVIYRGGHAGVFEIVCTGLKIIT
jgi:hypothetical protein